MRRVFTTAFFSIVLSVSSLAQSADTLVVITGNLYKAQDSTLITGNILFEKLPYYDDMGMASVGQEGYELRLLKGKTYNFSVSKSGFRKYESQLTANENKQFDIYVEEDILELRKLENLFFAGGSDQIGSSSYKELDELALWMNENPSVVIQLEGHTDFDGNAEANLRLSQSRVEAVKNYLIEKKVNKSRIFTKAFGGTQPVTQERTDEGKALNRRVEVRVIRR